MYDGVARVLSQRSIISKNLYNIIPYIGIYYTTLTRKRHEQHTQELFWEKEERR